MALRSGDFMPVTKKLKRLIRVYANSKDKDVIDPEEFHQCLFNFRKSSLQKNKTGDSYAALNFILLQLMRE